MTSATRRSVLAVVLVVLVAAAAAASAAGARSWAASCYADNRCDALTFRIVGNLLARGQSPYDPVARRNEAAARYLHGAQPPFDLPFQYPPYALPLFGAANLLWRSDVGEVVWAGLTAGLFVAAMAVFIGTVLPRGRAALVLVSLAFSSIPLSNASLNQTGAFIAVLLIAATWLWTRRPFVAGLLVGLAMVKPQYAIVGFLVALLRRDWRVVAGGITACAVLSVVSVASYGAGVWRAYPAALAVPNETLPYMVSWPGVLARFAGVTVQPRTTIAAYVAALALLCAMCFRQRRSGPPMDGESLFACALAWTFIFSPNTHPYDLMSLAPALILLAARRHVAWPVAWSAITWMGLGPPDRWLLFGATLTVAIALTQAIVSQRAAEQPFAAQP